MKLAVQSIPYRALQKVSGVVILLFFLATANDWGTHVAVGASAAVLAAAGAYEVAYYRRFDYELTADTLDISSGVISRREREIPYRRIQNVDVSRNVIQRAIGIAAVDLETAGGSSTEGSIRYVTPAEATRLQREVQRRKSATKARAGGTGSATGVGTATGAAGDASDGDDFAEPVEEDLFAISPGELALVGALSFDGRLIGLLAFVASGSVPVLSGFLPASSAALLTATAVVGLGLLVLVSWVIGAVVAFSNYYGFRLSRAGDELRYERGLFRRYSGSIPTEKVQTLTISDNPAKRALGYATLSIETAGYAPGQGGDYGSQAAVPIAATDRVYDLAREVEAFGDPEFSRPPTRIRWRYGFRYAMVVTLLTGIAFAIDWWVAATLPWYGPLALLLVVPLAAHLKWKHRGYWLGENHLLTRNGFWSRQVKAVPYYRIQNVIDTRTVFQRRWRVATVVADTAGTGSIVGGDAAAVDFDVTEAVTLREELTDRLQDALVERRARREPFEWLDVDDTDTDDTDDEEDTDTDEEAGTNDTSETTADGVDADDSTTSGDAELDETEPDDTGPGDTAADGVVRPEFGATDRDYSQPAETVDTGDYAVDHHPSDADVAYKGDENGDDGLDGFDDDDGEDEAEVDSENGVDDGENGVDDGIDIADAEDDVDDDTEGDAEDDEKRRSDR
ncbi:PH domain-containing protein [Halorubrum sp. JWXQ-INN 858]|uniref:PH domain-containing protein n=1 Tax=Halorubrum sp. JWXQ-INN 858 TaxID=2690782 RepID=UPI0013F7B4DC|nr:PH domain-containing protein [Halorubrum sp. JWXQ-INN 858]MWV65192.1 PH domain-containing protein [Halorubrum sp. JWXQ-INN 858]